MFSRHSGFPALFFLGMGPLVLVMLAEGLGSGSFFFPASTRSYLFFTLLTLGVGVSALVLSRRFAADEAKRDESAAADSWIGGEGTEADRTPIIYTSKQRYQALSDATFEAIFLSDQGVCLDQNLTAEKMFGYTLGEALGRLGTEWIVPEDRDRVMQNMLQGRLTPYRVRGLRKDGTTFPCEIQGRMFEQNGRVLRVTALRDITARVRAEEERDRVNLQLQQAQKQESLALLAGGAAQDFLNLMRMIHRQIAAANEELPSRSETGRRLELMESAAAQATKLAEQLQMYAGHSEPLLEYLELQDVLLELEPLLRAALRPEVRLDMRVQHDLPGFRGDRTQVSQVVINLITNAAESLPAGEGVVSLETGIRSCDEEFIVENRSGLVSDPARQPLPGRYVFIEIADNGRGMSEETLGRLFDPFFSTRSTGRGLGLAAVQGIMRGHGGLIQVQSRPDFGSRLTVYFPEDPDGREPRD